MAKRRRTLWPSFLFMVAFLAGTACQDVDFRPEASGPDAEITVVADSSLWYGPVGEAIREELERDVTTLPQPESMFDVVHRPLTSSRALDQVQRRKNVLFVAPLSDTTNTARFIKARLDSAVAAGVRDGRFSAFPRENLWYRDQLVYYITAPTTAELAQAVHENGQRLRDRFHQLVLNRMQEEMYDEGRQFAIEDSLMAEHDFAVNVQHDFLIVQDTANFIRMRRVLTNTWRDFFIYYVENADPSRISPQWIYQVRDSLTEKFHRGTFEGSYVEIDRRRALITQNINFLDRYAFKTRGLWRMTQDAMGGPFVNYTFYDEEQDRIYVLDGMVHAPGYDKREFLRQMEVMAQTFRTEYEAEQDTTTNSNQPQTASTE